MFLKSDRIGSGVFRSPNDQDIHVYAVVFELILVRTHK